MLLLTLAHGAHADPALATAQRHERAALFELWRVPAAGVVSAAPSVRGRTCFVGDWSGRFVAVDVQDGRVRWALNVRGTIAGPPAAVDDELVAFTAADSLLHVVGVSDGRPLWTFPLHSDYADQYGAALDARSVYVGSSLGMHALGRSDGAIRWQRHLEGRALGRPVVRGDTLYFSTMRHWVDSTGADGHVYALDAVTGALLWQRHLPRTPRFLGGARAGVMVHGDLVLVPGAGARLLALDRHTGAERWTHVFAQACLTACGATDSLVFAGAQDGALVALEAGTGRVRWQRLLPGSPEQGPIAVADGWVACASGDGNVHGFDAASGAPRFRLEAALNPTVRDHVLYCGGYELELRRHFIAAFQITPAAPSTAHGGTP